jgi:hypothetical protein
MAEPRLTNAINRALAACRLARDLLDDAEAPTDEIEANQRQRCRDQLDAMERQLNSPQLPDSARRVTGMAYIAADQWDPRSALTNAVINAEHEYLRVP